MAHAILSPSSASRWLSCTPSARLEAEFPDSAGEAAAEGTLAHELGELLIVDKLCLNQKEHNEKLVEIEQSKFYNEAMHEHADGYATYVLEQFAEAQAYTKDAVLFLEQRLDLTEYVPEGFGTGDCVIIADEVLHIIDLKYGKGVPVSAIENRQMMLYALGALDEFIHLYSVDRVRMTIYQPRLDNISTYELSVDELIKWGDEVLKPAAKKAFAGEGEFQPGEHCRFCKVRNKCRALADHNLEIAKHEFKMPPLLEDADIVDILGRVDGLVKWAKSIEDFAYAEALKGKKWASWKLVEGRSNRTFSDSVRVVDKLRVEGYSDAQIFKPATLIGITEMEKLVGKKEFNALLGDYIVKPPGKPALVPESDKRPELNNAAADFASVLVDEDADN